MTLPILSSTSIYNIVEITKIAGNYFELDYTVLDSTNNPVDLTASTCILNISYYGQPNFIALTKTGTITGLNTFKIVFNAPDTVNLSGKFVQQPVVTDFSGDVFIPGQGIINLLPKIQGS